jgi:hypothetical protein
MKRRIAFLALVAAVTFAPLVPASASPGDPSWSAAFAGTAGGRDAPAAVVSGPGRVFVAGTTTGDAKTRRDIVTIAYDVTTGAVDWVRRFDGPAHGMDIAVAAVYDEVDETVLVTGASETTRGGGSSDVVTLSYDAATGARLWARRFSATPTSNDIPVDIDAAGGVSFVAVSGTTHGRLVAYDIDGSSLWSREITKRHLASIGGVEASIGRVFVGASTFITYPGGSAFFTVSYKTGNGTPIWSKVYDGADHTQAELHDIALSSDGTVVYVTGIGSDYSKQPIATISYGQSNGARVWLKTIDPQPGGWLTPPHIAVSGDNASVAVAAGRLDNGVETYITRSYAAAGSTNWTARENGPGDAGLASDVVFASNGDVIVTGRGTDAGSAVGSLTIAYGGITGLETWHALALEDALGDGTGVVAVAADASRAVVSFRNSNDIETDAYLTS